ncbi:hypothetical protein L7F22_041576, partial [Adiantum nelumboides]|nr:hypothetical protein [Adiantum nelumboides]
MCVKIGRVKLDIQRGVKLRVRKNRGMRIAFPTPTQGQLSTEAMASFQAEALARRGPLVQACNFPLMIGVSLGLACAMRRARGGVEDLQTSVVAVFGSGALFSLVSGVGGPGKFPNAAQPPLKNLYYSNGRMILHNLCFELLDLLDIIKRASKGKGSDRKDNNEQFHEVPQEAFDDLQKEDKDLFEDSGFDMDNPNIDLDAGELGSPSSSQMKSLFLTL